MHELLCQTVQPAALHLRAIGEAVNALPGVGDTLLERQQGFAQRGLSNMADDTGAT